MLDLLYESIVTLGKFKIGFSRHEQGGYLYTIFRYVKASDDYHVIVSTPYNMFANGGYDGYTRCLLFAIVTLNEIRSKHVGLMSNRW